MSAQHTPGPYAAWPIPNDRLGRFTVVCVNEKECPGLGKMVMADKVRRKADAHLFAAAPELLEVARILVEANCPEAVAFATQRAHAAIAKAA